jgi:hypothetical protein
MDKNNTSILEFDFAIFDKENKLKILIEYDGEAHFIPIFPLNGSQEDKEKSLLIQKENDNRKNIYCKENNINLIRIPYTDKKNINIIIKNILGKFND